MTRKEFWIDPTPYDDGEGMYTDVLYEKPDWNTIHVIEFSEYEKSQAQLAIAVEALE